MNRLLKTIWPGLVGASARAELLRSVGVRSFSTDSTVTATAIRLHRKEKVLEVDFSDGSSFRYPAELLRVESPSAENTFVNREGARPYKVPSGRRDVNIVGIDPAGAYGVRLEFDDMHASGIFTWPYLRELGAGKFGRMRRYLRALRASGGSRDPRSARARAAPGPAAAAAAGTGAAGAAAAAAQQRRRQPASTPPGTRDGGAMAARASAAVTQGSNAGQQH